MSHANRVASAQFSYREQFVEVLQIGPPFRLVLLAAGGSAGISSVGDEAVKPLPRKNSGQCGQNLGPLWSTYLSIRVSLRGFGRPSVLRGFNQLPGTAHCHGKGPGFKSFLTFQTASAMPVQNAPAAGVSKGV
jgi:hypothetical protein